ncbi:hypothetical protein N8482_01500 [Chitinophagales bacterium]|nr:hypothetical protein [Chitinophagales bacterium]
MNSAKEFWYHLIHGTLDSETGVFPNLYCRGEHCGDAYAKAEQIAKEEGIVGPVLIEACRLDNLPDFILPAKAIQINRDSYLLPSFNSYELKSNEREFVPPVGIVFGNDEGELETELIKEAFVAFDKNEDGRFEFELVVDNSRLIKTFLKAIDFIPCLDGFQLYLNDHWDDSETELWSSKNGESKEELKNFLRNNSGSTLENGFVDIVILAKEGNTRLTLNEHKKIAFHTNNEELFEAFIENITKIGFEQTRDFYSIEQGYYHWHYRPKDSLNKMALTAVLRVSGFERLEIEERPTDE